MYKYLFTNPKAALGFVLFTMASVAMLVGSEEDEGLLAQAVDDVEEQREDFAREVDDLSGKGLFGGTGGRRTVAGDVESTQTWDEFGGSDSGAAPLEDDALIDPASGYDPTPSFEGPDDDGAPSPEVSEIGGGEIVGVIEGPGPGGPGTGQGLVRIEPGSIVDN